MNYTVKPIFGKVKNTSATVTVPGSKSITARALLIATLANGISVLNGVQFSDDCSVFLRCIGELGIRTKVSGNAVTVEGCGGKLPVTSARIHVGSAGTAARFLTALLALSKGTFTVDSSDQMKKRPQEPLIRSLEDIGARFTFLGEKYSFPFIVEGAENPRLDITVDIGKSSQYLSALLISSVCVGSPVHIRVSGTHGMDYVRMTLDMMWSFGVNVEEKDGAYTVSGAYTAKKYDIEPDVSAACYFYAVNKICGTNISVKGVMPRSMQGDVRFIRLLKDFGGGRVDMSAFSDQALTLAAVAPYLERPTEICGVSHIRGQECDRLHAIAVNLAAMGVRVEEREDGVTVYPCVPHGARIDTFGDHRVAMAFAVCGTRTEGVVIENAEVCSKTFREFFTVLDGVTEELCGAN